MHPVHRSCALSTLVGLLLSAAPAAWSAPISFGFSGQLNGQGFGSLPSLPAGTPFTVTYTLDPDDVPAQASDFFDFVTGNASATLQVGAFQYDADHLRVTVIDNEASSVDIVQLQASDALGTFVGPRIDGFDVFDFVISLIYPGTAFAGPGFPDELLASTELDSSSFRLSASNVSSGFVFLGDVDPFPTVSLSSVPEPGGAWLTLALLLGIFRARR